MKILFIYPSSKFSLLLFLKISCEILKNAKVITASAKLVILNMATFRVFLNIT